MLNDYGVMLSDSLLNAISDYHQGNIDSFKCIINSVLNDSCKFKVNYFSS